MIDRVDVMKAFRFRANPVALILIAIASSSFGQETDVAVRTYSVRPGDVLQVSVWQEPDLQREVLVRPDFAFSFPLAGDISTKGLSIVELQTELTQRLSRYLSNPVVTVSVSKILGDKIYVIGQVNKPGEFIVNPQVDVMQALSIAGGTSAFASANEVRILRRTASGQIVAIPFKYNDVLKGRNLDQNIILQSGDTVVVP